MELPNLDISTLSLHLKQEKLFVESERQHLRTLNEKLMKFVEKVYHASFNRGEQRNNYSDFLCLRPHTSTPACCQRANLLTQLQFVDAYHILGHNEHLFGELLNGLRTNPRLGAHCLVIGESLGQDRMQAAASIIFSSIYSNSIFPEDEQYTLLLLKYLMELQLAPSDNPRRLLHKGSCAFNQIYKAYVDTLPQAKVFLTAALHQPIMQLLMEDELFLDIDPSKAVFRFPPQERLQRFGQEGTPEYAESLHKYRCWIIKKLVKITNRFIDSIKQSLHCFPSSLGWLIRTFYEVLLTQKQAEMREVNAICVYLMFDFFLCSAIVSPEPQGIIEAPISHISRFNLIQVAQILQVLALNQWESPDPRLADLYSNFDKDVMSDVIEHIIGQRSFEGPPVSAMENFHFVGLSRSSAMIPEPYLYSFVNFLFDVLQNLPEDSSSKKELERLIGPLKTYMSNIRSQASQQQSLSPSQGLNSSGDGSGAVNHSSPNGSPKKNLLNKVKGSRRSQKLAYPSEATIDAEDSSSQLNVSSLSQSGSSVSSIPNQTTPNKESKDEEASRPINTLGYENVLVVSLNVNCAFECPGMMPEDKVLAAVQAAKPPSRVRILDDDGIAGGSSDGTIEKRTRFSLSHDEGSIGNTSDNLEAISEAASNHSVSSSLDDVEQADQPDNLSDMVSANVSGRGTPNVSGRDTPSSQVTDGDDAARGTEAHRQTSNNSVTISKPASADIEEKFGRFEIKPIIGGDETVSLVSDTWSTDVLASDSETIEAVDRENRADELHAEFLDQHLKELDRMHGVGPEGFSRGESAGEIFDTASEAWSTDVLASDSERLTEFDTDDAQSVARSDDTGRSEIEIELVSGDALLRPDAAQNTEENSTPRVLASRSPVDSLKLNKRGDADFVSPIATSDANNVWETSGVATNSSNSVEDSNTSSGVRFIPVMQISQDESLSNSTNSFRPIRDFEEDNVVNGNQDPELPLLREVHSEASATQSLGRLSLTLSDLPNNGLILADQPLLLNQFVREGKSSKEAEEKSPASKEDTVNDASNSKLTKRKTPEGHSKLVSVGSSAEDSSIHLSTASLASSSSSGSDAPHAQGAKDKRILVDSNATGTRDHMALTNTLSAPPTSLAATGAIPKSISFDKTAEKGDKDGLDVDPKHKRGFFKGFKLPGFKNRRKVMSTLSSRSDDFPLNRPFCGSDIGIRRSSSEDSRQPILEETSDDILAKYRKKPDAVDADGNIQIEALNGSFELIKVDDGDFIDIKSTEVGSYVFNDAKRKLRIVLSSSDFSGSSCFTNLNSPNNIETPQFYDIVKWLQMQLAEARNLHNRSLIAQLHETLRCIELFDHQGREKLLQSLKDEYQNRSSYIAYLVRSKQGLLNSIAHFEKLLSRIKADTNIIMDSMVNVCVRLFLEKRDEQLSNFAQNFTKLTVSDEKVDLVETFLEKLYQELERDPMWISSTTDQLILAQMNLERAVMSHIYIHALYPNGDADVSRDQVLHEHIKKLSNIITPSHKDLRISKIYHFECPWPSAQAELSHLGAYKTAGDKLRCVVRAAQTIMNLLSMAHETTVPSADDFIPVFVFVIIKANPLAMLSTIQYVNLFFDQRLQGEDHYWWTQFCSAVEFIKTMDYTA